MEAAQQNATFVRVTEYNPAQKSFMIEFFVVSSDKSSYDAPKIPLEKLTKNLKITSAENKQYFSGFPSEVYCTKRVVIADSGSFIAAFSKNNTLLSKDLEKYDTYIVGSLVMQNKDLGTLSYFLLRKEKIKYNNINAVRQAEMKGDMTFNLGTLYLLSSSNTGE
jgi:hypothetical protein